MTSSTSKFVVDLKQEQFQSEVIERSHSTPVLVDFWAPWCAPCRHIAPIVEELATEYEGKVGFAKVNTDENGPIAAKYGISSIPTLIVFKDGQPVKHLVGLRPKRDLKASLDEALV